eukprot:XP_001699056.1 predicted protein [Chlamydomonas reinhardtii]
MPPHASLRSACAVLLVLVAMAGAAAAREFGAKAAATNGGAAAAVDSRPAVVLAVFGDSLSDTGNTFRAAGIPQADLYYQGRFSNTTQLTVLNYAHGGAAACPENGAAAQYPFIRDLPSQTSAFLADISAPQTQGQLGGGRRLLPVSFIGNNDVRNVLTAALGAGGFPTEQAVAALVGSITSCRLAWAQQLLGAGEAVWRQQRGAERVLVLLPVARLDITPSAPELLKPVACFFHPAYVLAVVPGIVPVPRSVADLLLCQHNATHLIKDPLPLPAHQLHPTTRLQKAFALRGVLPALQQAGLLPAAAA